MTLRGGMSLVANSPRPLTLVDILYRPLSSSILDFDSGSIERTRGSIIYNGNGKELTRMSWSHFGVAMTNYTQVAVR